VQDEVCRSRKRFAGCRSGAAVLAALARLGLSLVGKALPGPHCPSAPANLVLLLQKCVCVRAREGLCNERMDEKQTVGSFQQESLEL